MERNQRAVFCQLVLNFSVEKRFCAKLDSRTFSKIHLSEVFRKSEILFEHFRINGTLILSVKSRNLFDRTVFDLRDINIFIIIIFFF